MTKQYPREKKPYEQWEIEFLEDTVGVKSFLYMSKKLGRPPEGIESKLQRLGLLNTKLEAGWISLFELTKTIHIRYTTAIRWRKELDLPLRSQSLRFGKGKQTSWVIKPDEFWKWADKHRELIDWNKYEIGSLLPEPDWLNEAIRVHRETTARKSNQPWTPREEAILWDAFYRRGLTAKEIAKELDRSINSVHRKLARLRERKGVKPKC